MRHKQAQGEYIGGQVPYGFRLDGEELVEEAAEQAVIREVRALRSAGLSLRAIAGELDKRGIRTRNGKTFAAIQIQRMGACARP